MKAVFSLFLMFSFVLLSCNSEPSLQKYFVENTENKNFVAVDIAPSILGIDKSKLTVEQSEALTTLKKVNILAFKLDGANASLYETEKEKVKTLLKDPQYQQLMKFGAGATGASISFVGDEAHIDEFILFANNKKNGFAIVKVLGKNMNPNGIITLLSVLKDANIDIKQLEPLQQMIPKDLE